MTKPTISYEFFPPKTPEAEKSLWEAVPVLASLDPDFMTVTYGAGGSTRDKTVEVVTEIQDKTNIPMAAHLTYINATRQELYDLAQELWDKGIKHLVALRGDVPDDLALPLDPHEDYFQYTSHFVAALKARQNFEISVGCYPEKHPDSPSIENDVEALMKKIDAGATRAITQFFFENDKFYEFRDACKAMNVKAPISPGMLPIHDFKNMCRFAKRCQAHVPDWLHEKFAGTEDKPEEAHKIATDLLVEQVTDLAKNGVEHMHFYTLNKSAITREACEALGYKAKAA